MSRREHEPEGGETREMILRTARMLFMERGYRAVSTRQIAEACDVTQPALYHHFATKQELYVAMLTEELAGTRTALERIVSQDKDLEEQLRRIARYLSAQTGPSVNQMLHDIIHELDAAARRFLNARFFEDLVMPIASVFAAGQQEGRLRLPGSGGLAPPAAALLLLTVLQRPGDRVAAMEAAPLERATGDQVQADLLVEILLHGLTTAPASPSHQI
jgi:AcrR family transcriptional regulator